MFSQVFGEDQDVVKVNCYLAFGNEVMEDVVHYPLECGRRICEPEEHDGGLEQAKVRMECGLFFISFFDLDVVVSPTNVKLCEVLGPMKLVDKFQD